MKVFFHILAILFVVNINAQKFDCSPKIKEYQDSFQVNKIAETYDIWSEVRKKCPKFSEEIYTDGINILQYKIDNEKSDEEKEKLVRDLLKLHDEHHTNFPLNTPDFEISKAMTLYDNKVGTQNEVFNLLDSGFSKAPQSITNAKAIYVYFSMYYEKYKLAEKNITSESVIEKYTFVNSMLSQLQISNPEKSNEYKTAQIGIIALARDTTTCDNLSAYYEKNYTANQDNPDWLTTALINLSEKCSAKPIFYTLAEKLYSNKVTSQSANYLALAYTKQRKFPEAIRLYTQAEELETNLSEKAKINYMLATGLLSNDKAKSKELLNKASTQDPKMGKSYLYLSQLYSNSAEECGKTDFEKKAVYYLAIETAKKAGIAEPRLKVTADKITEDLSSKTLSSTDISDAKMKGKSFKIGCWINETITFPPK